MRQPPDVELGLKHPVGDVVEARAAATVRKWVTDPVEQAEVLAMLGLDHVRVPTAGVQTGYRQLAAAIVAAEDTEGSP